MSRLRECFARARAEGRAALMPYLTIGYPAHDSALTLAPALADSGADIIELGIPFSDPLADGATIQASTQKALENGITLRACLAQAQQIRAGGVASALVLMGYYNPIYQMGLDAFAEAAHAAGVDGVIVPDLPPEEAGALDEALRQRGLDYIYMLAPTSDESRLALVAAKARGFLYLVSLTGVTGARAELPPELPDFVARVRAATEGSVPLAVGFGIGSPEAARQVGALADGVIVGSALIRRLADPATAEAEARTFVGALRDGLNG